jgi:hypothetical protein
MILDRIDVKVEGGFDIKLPNMVKIEQHFDRQRLEDIPATVRDSMNQKLNPAELKNKRIAVAVGSRGIANLSVVVGSVVAQLKEWEALPFIIPAMGSHGGAAAEGQIEILEEYGITEQTMGAPIVSSMETVQVGSLPNGIPVYVDKHAHEADAIVVVNRVKPHTDFKGDFESGLLKMMAIGLGKHKGATILHSYGFDQFHELIPETGKAILQNTKIAFGVAIMENAYDETKKVEIVPRDEMVAREKELLIEAKASMPKFLMSSIDVLIVDQIGKNISGAGMDPNITGRTGSGLPGFSAPSIQKVVILGLTEQTHGNAIGIGLADVTTLDLINKINFSYTYANTITATVLNAAKIPLVMNTDEEAVVIALKTCNRITPETAKIIRIKNTLEMHEIQVSEAYLEELKGRNDISILSDPEPLRFTEQGKLI